MKKFLLYTSFLVMLFLSCIQLNGASTAKAVLTKSSEPMKFVLHTTALKSQQVKFSIISNEGFQVYFDRINTRKDGERLFDMSQLPSGEYIIELEEELKISRFKLSINEQTIQLDQNPEYLFKPTFRILPNDKVGMTLLTLGHTIKVELSDGEQNLHSLIIKDNNAISKIYDLSQLRRGEYVFTVTTKDRVFYHTVNI